MHTRIPADLELTINLANDLETVRIKEMSTL